MIAQTIFYENRYIHVEDTCCCNIVKIKSSNMYNIKYLYNDKCAGFQFNTVNIVQYSQFLKTTEFNDCLNWHKIQEKIPRTIPYLQEYLEQNYELMKRITAVQTMGDGVKHISLVKLILNILTVNASRIQCISTQNNNIK